MSDDLTFTLTQQEAQAILDALVLRPYREVVALVDKLQRQAAEQMQSPT